MSYANNMPETSERHATVPAPAGAGSVVEKGATASDLDAAAVNSLRTAVMRLSRRLKHQRVDESLSPTEMSVLGTLARCGSATPSELAHKEQVQPPSMTRIVASLEERKLVIREPDPNDRRIARVRISEEGEAYVETSRTRRNEYLADRLATFTNEERKRLEQALPLLERLAEWDESR
jgi:DNA-binding MarR family transcriptional regulator